MKTNALFNLILDIKNKFNVMYSFTHIDDIVILSIEKPQGLGMYKFKVNNSNYDNIIDDIKSLYRDIE